MTPSWEKQITPSLEKESVCMHRSPHPTPHPPKKRRKNSWYTTCNTKKNQKTSENIGNHTMKSFFLHVKLMSHTIWCIFSCCTDHMTLCYRSCYMPCYKSCYTVGCYRSCSTLLHWSSATQPVTDQLHTVSQTFSKLCSTLCYGLCYSLNERSRFTECYRLWWYYRSRSTCVTDHVTQI